jgi:hypothetical protein
MDFLMMRLLTLSNSQESRFILPRESSSVITLMESMVKTDLTFGFKI